MSEDSSRVPLKGLSVRMNFSHGEYEYHQSVIDNTRKMVAGMQDQSCMDRSVKLFQPIRMGVRLQSPSTPSVLFPHLSHTLSQSSIERA
jgi:hypothetical protein